uniref:Cyclin-like domain-containing protein n=1 Tax=Fibrocapsa japonica TaxID=94617 RepID=A0A7S2V373_9STRA|mmetsp:Transcript_5006/g.7596  ORF Transcript_5006/g.7596 Transcript_5006/m.7596 type:complete len:345 (+) Transcript_5006:89-1123(+)
MEGGEESLAVKIKNLQSREHNYRPKGNYLAIQEHGMKAGWRKRIIKWYVEVAQNFDLSRDAISISINFLDRYLSKKSCSKLMFQLAGMTTVFMAAKIESSRSLQVQDLLPLSADFFSAADVAAMELDILGELKCHLNPPTPYDFLRGLASVFPIAFEVAEGYVDRSHNEYEMLQFAPSAIAISAAALAFSSPGHVCGRYQCSCREQFILSLETVGLDFNEGVRMCEERMFKCFQVASTTMHGSSASPNSVGDFLANNCMGLPQPVNGLVDFGQKYRTPEKGPAEDVTKKRISPVCQKSSVNTNCISSLRMHSRKRLSTDGRSAFDTPPRKRVLVDLEVPSQFTV